MPKRSRIAKLKENVMLRFACLVPMLLTGLMNITKKIRASERERRRQRRKTKQQLQNYSEANENESERESRGRHKRAQHSHRIDSIKFENNIRSIGTHKFPFDHYKYGIFFLVSSTSFSSSFCFVFCCSIAIIVNIVIVVDWLASCALASLVRLE